MKVLVIGCGSIGRRHLKNLAELGVSERVACDLSAARLEQVRSECGVEALHTDLDAALATGPDAAIVCPVTAAHVPVARRALDAGCHLMVEKPVSHTEAGVESLVRDAAERRRVFMVAYSMRLHPGLRRVEEMLRSGRIGRPLSARACCGQYLPDWHPWEDYRDFYMSREADGGGAVLDISHEIDTLRRYFGEVRQVAAMVSHLSDLEIDTDDCSELVLRFDSGVVASCHLDLVQRAYRRTLEVFGTEGTILWDYVSQSIQLYTVASAQWELVRYDFDRNRLYLDEAARFLAACRGEERPPVDGADGLRTLKVVLAAKRASREGRTVAP